jgi:hypothetical protein
MYGVFFQSGSSRTEAVGVECLYLWALHIAYSSAEERRPTLFSGRARETPVHVLGM